MKPRPLIPGTKEWDMVAEIMERMGQEDPWEGMTPEEIRRENEEFQLREQELKAKRNDAGRDQRRSSYLDRTYGLSQDQVTALIRSQNGRCAACKAPFTQAKEFWACVDHDHATGRVRGLLCRLCNLTLGHAHDNPEILRGLIRYLERQDHLASSRSAR